MFGPRSSHFRFPPFFETNLIGRLLLSNALSLALVLAGCSRAVPEDSSPAQPASADAGLSYHNYRDRRVPWSIHVVRVSRRAGAFEVHSVHAQGKAVGLSKVTDQTELIRPNLGVPVAAINGDFYQRDGSFAGDPRGLQIVEGELISAPSGTWSCWIDASGEPHTGITSSRFEITWPDGSASRFDLNANRSPNGIVLYTPAIGASTRTAGGTEIILEQQAPSDWLPLQPNKTYRAKVREIREGGDSPIPPETVVLSLGPQLARRRPSLEAGAEISISTATQPNLRDAKTALSGGPALVQNGRRQRIQPGDFHSYSSSSMKERHPRSAIGWNADYYFLVEVDGRQRALSVGMTLDELAAYMIQLGCQEAMNLDGGGSATIWFDGKLRNRPCDGMERSIANSLIVIKKEAPEMPSAPTAAASPKQ